MTSVFFLTLMTFAGLVVALARPRSLVARLTSIGLAVLMGGLGLLMIVSAHRLAEEEPPEASSRSAGFQLGVERMRTIVSLPLPLLLAAGTTLAMLALVPYQPERKDGSLPSRS